VAGAVGLATAYELSCAERPAMAPRLMRLRDRLRDAVLAVPGTELTGHPRERLPGLLSILARDVDGPAACLSLDLAGIAASVGSACATGSSEVSHVLTAMGYPEEEARGALRMSLGRTTTEDEIGLAATVIPQALRALRAAAPEMAADPLGQSSLAGEPSGREVAAGA
jgi:cysteine desulfurase